MYNASVVAPRVRRTDSDDVKLLCYRPCDLHVGCQGLNLAMWKSLTSFSSLKIMSSGAFFQYLTTLSLINKICAHFHDLHATCCASTRMNLQLQ